jgi:glycogen debranching enzyme
VYLPYYAGYVSHLSFESRCETYGNILACLTGLADKKKTNLIVDFIIRAGINKPYPVKVMYPPIYPGEESWFNYMAKGRQNYPWQYHNAGIWPYVGGFWVKLLAKMKHPLAKSELESLAKANKEKDWKFNEYLHGQHGTPMGVEYQSWSMAMYIGAYNDVKNIK